jgi:hypothetical protein
MSSDQNQKKNAKLQKETNREFEINGPRHLQPIDFVFRFCSAIGITRTMGDFTYTNFSLIRAGFGDSGKELKPCSQQ